MASNCSIDLAVLVMTWICSDFACSGHLRQRHCRRRRRRTPCRLTFCMYCCSHRRHSDRPQTCPIPCQIPCVDNNNCHSTFRRFYDGILSFVRCYYLWPFPKWKMYLDHRRCHHCNIDSISSIRFQCHYSCAWRRLICPFPS